MMNKENKRKMIISQNSTGIKLLSFCIALLSFMTFEANAQEFTKAYGSTGNTEFSNGYFSISHDAYFVVGTTNQSVVTLSKIDRNGNVIWSKKYSGSFFIFSASEIKVPGKNTTDVILAPCEYGTYENLYVMRINGETGDVVWSKKYKYASENRFIDIIVTKDQHIIATTDVRYAGGIFAVKLDYNGNAVWSKLIKGNGELQRTTQYVSDENNGIVFGIRISNIYGVASLTEDGNIGFIKQNTNNLHFRNMAVNPNGTYTLSGYINYDTKATNHQLILTDKNFNILWYKVLNPVNSTSSYCEGCANVPSFMNSKGEIISIRESAISGEIRNSYSKFSSTGVHLKTIATNNNDIQIFKSNYVNLNNNIISMGNTTRDNICLPSSKNAFLTSLKDDLDICDTYEFTPRITNPTTSFVDIDKSILNVTNTTFTLTNVNTTVTNNDLKARNICSNEVEKVNLGPDIAKCTSGNVTLNAGTGYKSYTWSTGGASPTLQVSSTGTYWVRTVDDCDRVSSDTIRVTISVPSSRNQAISICQGQSYSIGNNRYTIAGTYTDTLKNIAGCDSIVRTTLTIKSVASKTQSISICSGDSVRIGQNIYKNAGTYYDTLKTSSGCDSILTTIIQIRPVSQTSLTYRLCAGQSVIVGQNTYSSTGVYTDILKNIHGCDSTVTTNLFVASIQTDTKAFSICKGDSVTVGSQIYFSEGIFKDTIRSGAGCDSIYNIIHIDFVQELHLDLGADTSVCSDEILRIGTDIQGVSYIWSNQSTESHTDAQAPGIYSLTISNACYNVSDTITIEAIDCDCKVFIPNAFSPNSDGKNDVLIIKEENITTSRFIIYNKWGEEVFATDNNQIKWNGAYKEKQLPPDVYGYYYSGICLKGSNVEYKGNITIVR